MADGLQCADEHFAEYLHSHGGLRRHDIQGDAQQQADDDLFDHVHAQQGMEDRIAGHC